MNISFFSSKIKLSRKSELKKQAYICIWYIAPSYWKYPIPYRWAPHDNYFLKLQRKGHWGSDAFLLWMQVTGRIQTWSNLPQLFICDLSLSITGDPCNNNMVCDFFRWCSVIAQHTHLLLVEGQWWWPPVSQHDICQQRWIGHYLGLLSTEPGTH